MLLKPFILNIISLQKYGIKLLVQAWVPALDHITVIALVQEVVFGLVYLCAITHHTMMLLIVMEIA